MAFKLRAALFLSSIVILTQVSLVDAGAAERLDSLEEQVSALQQMSAERQAKKYTTQDSRRVLNEVVSNFSAEELKQIKEQGDVTLPAEKQKLWGQLKSRYFEIENSQDHFIETFDKTASAEIDFLTDFGASAVSQSHQEILSGLSKKDAQQLDKRYKALKERYETYLDSKKLFGTNKDHVRRTNLDRAVAAFRDYYVELERLAGPKQTLGQRVSETIRNTLGALKWIFEKLKILANVLPDGAGLVKSVFFPSSKVEPGKLDFTKNLYETVKSYTKAQGIQVDIQGRENIPAAPPSDGRVLNVFTPSHRSAVNDLFLMAHYTPEDTLIFAALERFLPKPLVAPVSKNPAMITVSKKGGAIKALVEKLKGDTSRNVVIYPEGGIPAGIKDSLPIQKGFGTVMLEALSKEGYEVRIIPVTYLDAARFSNRVDLSEKNIKLTARVSEPIDPKMFLAMRAIGKDDQSTSRFIRSTWFENLPTDSDHVMGLLRPKAALAETEAFITRGKGQKSFCYPYLSKALQELQ